ncbi:MAG TPA: type II toxin-antitoxin system HicB family antitoxin [Spirochaetota bacterium]|nr:type II toxin-antitoxin system HicB family antitoxin [Spirochaetota bacterium]
MKYHFSFEEDERGGYWGECLEIQGCLSEGNNLEDFKKNLKEALDLCLECALNDEEDFILPFDEKEIREKNNILEISPEPSLMLSNMIKNLRKKYNLTQKEVAERMGYKSIWGYSKIESGKYSNIEFKTLGKIKSVFPDIDLNLIFS